MNIEYVEAKLSQIIKEDISGKFWNIINPQWINQMGLVSTIAPFGLEDEEIKIISEYCKKKDICELYHVPAVHSFGEFDLEFLKIINPTFEAIKQADFPAIFERVFFPDNLDFVVLSDGEACFHILVGNQEFIKSVTQGRDVRQEYFKYVSSDSFTNETRPYFLCLAEKYPGIRY